MSSIKKTNENGVNSETIEKTEIIEECPICLEALNHPKFNVYSLKCEHKFHLECLSDSLKANKDKKNNNTKFHRECPYCRAEIKHLIPRFPYELPIKNIHQDYEDFTENVFSLQDLQGILLNPTQCSAISYVEYNKRTKIYSFSHKSSQCKRKTKNDFCNQHSKKLDATLKIYCFPK